MFTHSSKAILPLLATGFLVAGCNRAPESVERITNAVTRPSYNTGSGFFVSSGKIYDANGNEFIIRGTNYEVWSSPTDQANAIAGMNNARLNTARLNLTQGTGAGTETFNADTAQRFIDGGIVPIPVVISLDGSWTDPSITTCKNDPALITAAVDNWVGPQRDWLVAKERYIMLDIANEWGDPNTAWRDTYITAITRLRNAGIKALVLIEIGGECSQNAQSVESWGQAIMDADPQHNIAFEVKNYAFWLNPGDPAAGSWNNPFPDERQPYDMSNELGRLKATGLPLVIGEYCGWHGGGDGTCAYDLIPALSTYEAQGIGYMSWEWMNVHASFATVTLNNVYNSSSDLSSWGRVTIEDPTWGSKARAQKATIFTGGCTSNAQCDDGNSCTSDTCNAGVCSHTPINGCGAGETQLLGIASGGTDDFQVAGEAYAWSYAASASGTATRLDLFVNASNTASALQLGLYTDNGGQPGTLLASGTVNGALVANAWNSVSISAPIVAGTTYWLAALQPAGSNGTLHYNNTLTNNGNERGSSANPTLSTFQSSWTSGVLYSGYQATVRAVNAGGSNPPPSDTAQYNFENGAQGWLSWTSGVTLAQSSAQKYAGSFSLATTINASGAQTKSSQVDNPATPAGTTVTSHVWCPPGAPISSVTAWVQQGGMANGACGAFQWTGNTTGIAPGQWNTISVTVPSCSIGLSHLGVDFNLTGAWSGTCYTDTVGW
jgi:mannan endo-1,4-beta-mannosidase